MARLYLTPEQIARVCHEANRAYCMSIGDHSHPTWDMAPVWQKQSAIAGVNIVIKNPDTTPAASHESWYAGKEAAGWKHGPVKAPELKEHPCMVPYEELPEEQRTKDYLFLAVAKALIVHTVARKPPMKEAVQANLPGPVEDSTLETGVLTADGDMLKDAEVVATVKPKSGRRTCKSKPGPTE